MSQKSEQFSNANLIWIDLEMTGLCCQHDHIIEIATVITDTELNAIAEGPVFAIHQPDSVLEAMDSWNQRQHGGSGLYKRVQESTTTLAEAEKATLDFVSQYVGENKSPMCGNSICQDRRFLAREMPALEKHFHYRHIDVSTLKELAGRWHPDVYSSVQKKCTHLALDDIYDSINELRHYRKYLFGRN